VIAELVEYNQVEKKSVYGRLFEGWPNKAQPFKPILPIWLIWLGWPSPVRPPIKRTSINHMFFQHGDNPLKTSANFHNFWPYPPPVSSFFLLSVGKFRQFLTAFPPKKVNVLNGWSHGCHLRIHVDTNIKRKKMHFALYFWISFWTVWPKGASFLWPIFKTRQNVNFKKINK
jgi:hypothetical protein